VIALSVSSFIIVLFMLVWPGELLFMCLMILFISSRVIDFVMCLSRLPMFMLAEAYGIVLCICFVVPINILIIFIRYIEKKKIIISQISLNTFLSHLFEELVVVMNDILRLSVCCAF